MTRPVPGKASIEWTVEPEFRLIHSDRLYQNFEVAASGQAILRNDQDEMLIVRFDNGWVTDITSSPLVFQLLVPRIGPHTPAAVLHDRLLEMGMRRPVARKWMWLQLQQLPLVSRKRRLAMYAGVWLWDYFVAPFLKERSRRKSFSW